jgi:hypothetical protein
MSLLKGVQATITFDVINTATWTPRTGDAANLTMRVIKDGGVPAAATNSPTEKENGVYALVLTATEMTASEVCVEGSSSTASTYVVPRHIMTRISAATEVLDADPDDHTTAGMICAWFREMRQKLVGKSSIDLATNVETLYDTDDATSLGTMTHSQDASTVDRTQIS